MLYRPKYCCQCGEKIERIEWKFWSSRRFCELCETEFVVGEWAPKVYLGLSLIIGIFLFGNYLQVADRPKTTTASPPALVGTQRTSRQKESGPRPESAAGPENLLKEDIPGNGAPRDDKTAQQTAASEGKSETRNRSAPFEGKAGGTDEAVFICGAETKKGTPCSRRV